MENPEAQPPHESPQAAIEHPLTDGAGDGYVYTASAAPVVELSAARADFLVSAARRGLRAAVITRPDARATFPLLQALEVTESAWLISEGGSDLRDALSGRPLAHVADAFRAAPTGAPPTDAAGPAVQSDADHEWVLSASVTVRHPPTEETVLGDVVETLGRELVGGGPRSWGTHEPATVAWDPHALTQFARERMPQPTRLVVASSGDTRLSGTILARRSVKGVDELTRVMFGLGEPSDAARATIARVPETLASLADGPRPPLIATVFLQTADARLTVGAHPQSPPIPVAVLLGPRAVRDLGLDVADTVERFGAIRCGRPRLPSLAIPFARDVGGSWEQAIRFAESLGADDVLRALGRYAPDAAEVPDAS